MKARVKDITVNTITKENGLEKEFSSGMEKLIGKEIDVVKFSEVWYKDDQGFVYHESWLDFETNEDICRIFEIIYTIANKGFGFKGRTTSSKDILELLLVIKGQMMVYEEMFKNRNI